MLDVGLQPVFLVADAQRFVFPVQRKQCIGALGQTEPVADHGDDVEVFVRGHADDAHEGVIAGLAFLRRRVDDDVEVHVRRVPRRPEGQPVFLEPLGVVGLGIEQHLTAEDIRPHLAALLGQAFPGEQHRLSVHGAVHRCRVNAGLGGFTVHHGAVGVVVMVARPDIPGPPAFHREVARKPPGVRHLADHVRRGHGLAPHHVVVDHQ